MTLIIEQYKEILAVAVDHQLAYLKGKTLFDDHDPAVEQDGILRKGIERYVKQKNTGKLETILNYLISFFSFHDEFNFSRYLFEKTGYQIKPIPKENISLGNRRRLHISVSGNDERSLTCVQVLLPTTSGVIYCCTGSHPKLKAAWIDDHTIELEIPVTDEEITRVNQVRYHNETIRIICKDPCNSH